MFSFYVSNAAIALNLFVAAAVAVAVSLYQYLLPLHLLACCIVYKKTLHVADAALCRNESK